MLIVEFSESELEGGVSKFLTTGLVIKAGPFGFLISLCFVYLLSYYG